MKVFVHVSCVLSKRTNYGCRAGWHAYIYRLPAAACEMQMRDASSGCEMLGPGRRISSGRCAGAAGAATPASVRAALSYSMYPVARPLALASAALSHSTASRLSRPLSRANLEINFGDKLSQSQCSRRRAELCPRCHTDT